MEVTVRNLDGSDADSVELPAVFDTQYRPDLIARAVRVAQANRKQDYGADEFAGKRTPAESLGSGRGMAHVPRQDGRARRVPQAVKGRKAHPPKAEKEQGESINTKTKKLAIRSAVAATTDAELVAERGHRFDADTDVPVVVDDEFEDLQKTKEVVEFSRPPASPTTSNAPRRAAASALVRESPWPEVQDAKVDPFVTSSETGPSWPHEISPGPTSRRPPRSTQRISHPAHSRVD